jgi:ribosomal protein S18 acetylase RimI-like enzyme
VIRLWQDCGLVVPWNDPVRDIGRKLDQQPELFLVGEAEGEVVATVMVGYDGHRGWINYLGVRPSHQKRGIGRLIMSEAEARLRSLGCPKINLQVRSTNTAAFAFCEAIGFVADDVLSMGKRLVDDSTASSAEPETPSP